MQAISIVKCEMCGMSTETDHRTQFITSSNGAAICVAIMPMITSSDIPLNHDRQSDSDQSLRLVAVDFLAILGKVLVIGIGIALVKPSKSEAPRLITALKGGWGPIHLPQNGMVDVRGGREPVEQIRGKVQLGGVLFKPGGLVDFCA